MGWWSCEAHPATAKSVTGLSMREQVCLSLSRGPRFAQSRRASLSKAQRELAASRIS